MLPSTPVLPFYQVLVVEPSPIIGGALLSYFQQFYGQKPFVNGLPLLPLKVDVVCNLGQAKAALQAAQVTPYHLVLCDTELEGENGLAFLATLHQQFPQSRPVVWSARPLDTFVEGLKGHQLTSVLCKTVPFCFDELAEQINRLLSPQLAFGLSQYLPAQTPITQFCITNTLQLHEAFMALQQFFITHHIPQKNDLCTVLIEALTNAVYHATPHESGTGDKYEKGQFIEALEPEEYVTLSYGFSPLDTSMSQSPASAITHNKETRGTLAVAITDQGGRLSADRFLYWLARNMNDDNLLDTSGRGLFLMYMLADRLALNILVNQKTELIFIKTAHPVDADIKPLLLNIIASPKAGQ